ncbi:MAG: hypothetical protein LBI04_04350 [Treponema sp.]|jgi:hypothetical protein|nr:hypothetical protein [Treponema sp.]
MHDGKVKKVSHDFSLLNEEQQDYILGIMQALIFAKNTNKAETKKKKTADISSVQEPGSSLI